jgi:NADPH-dependent ferric siderophore reductase
MSTEPVTAPTSPPAPRGRPAPLRAEVRRVETLSSRFRRVVLGGGQLDQFSWPGPASHLKLVLPLPGDSQLDLPEPDADGLVRYDRSRMVLRTYTPRAWDPGAGELTLDLFLHGEGPASVWAGSVKPGDVVGLSRPRARYDINPDADWLVVAGDESAVPAIATILDARPADLPTTVVVECDGEDRDLGLPVGSDPVLAERSREPGAALLEALNAALPAEGDGRVWVAGEARGIRKVRAHLLHERRLPAASMVTRGYWRQGEADHPDHDFGED